MQNKGEVFHCTLSRSSMYIATSIQADQIQRSNNESSDARTSRCLRNISKCFSLHVTVFKKAKKTTARAATLQAVPLSTSRRHHTSEHDRQTQAPASCISTESRCTDIRTLSRGSNAPMSLVRAKGATHIECQRKTEKKEKM